MIEILNGEVYQWDTGREVKVDNVNVCEVHFASCNSDCAFVTVPVDGIAPIPNELLQSANNFVVYAVCESDTCEQTVEQLRVFVKERAKPDDYVYTETEVFSYKKLEARVDELEKNGGSGTGGVSGVSDVTINGTSIVTDGVANIPIASNSNLGAVKTMDYVYGIGVVNDIVRIVSATESEINNRGTTYKPIVPKNLPYAVKSAMTSTTDEEWSATEKANARNRMGLEWTLLGDVTVEEDGVVEIDIPIDNPNYNEYQFFIVLADRTDTTNKSMLVNFDSLNTNTYTLAQFATGTNKNYSGRGYVQRHCNSGWLTLAIGGSGNQQASTMTTNASRANNYSKGATWNTESPTAINVSLSTGLDTGTRFVVYAR